MAQPDHPDHIFTLPELPELGTVDDGAFDVLVWTIVLWSILIMPPLVIVAWRRVLRESR